MMREFIEVLVVQKYPTVGGMRTSPSHSHPLTCGPVSASGGTRAIRNTLACCPAVIGFKLLLEQTIPLIRQQIVACFQRVDGWSR